MFCPDRRVLLAGQHKVYISAWLHWKALRSLPARKLAVLSTFLLCHLRVFKNEWHPGSLYLWREPCSSRENLVRAGVSKGCLDASWNHLQEAHAYQGTAEPVQHVDPLFTFSFWAGLANFCLIIFNWSCVIFLLTALPLHSAWAMHKLYYLQVVFSFLCLRIMAT